MKIFNENGESVSSLTQWEQDRELITDVEESKEYIASIFNSNSTEAYVVPVIVEGTKGKFKIPNKLLQKPYTIFIVIYSKNVDVRTAIGKAAISVIPAAKPSDYEFVENIEYTDWVQLTEDAKLFMEQMADSKRACDTATQSATQAKDAANTATENANAKAQEAANVDIDAVETPTGADITIINRNGERKVVSLDTVVFVNYWKDVLNLVRGGAAEKLFPPGYMFNSVYKNPMTGEEYELPWHVFDHRDLTLADGTVKRGMLIQAHFSLPEDVRYDYHEAFYHADTELPAGTYHVVIPDAWSKIQAGDTWSFTLTQPVPTGGVIAGFEDIASYGDMSGKLVKTYANVEDLVPIEEATLRRGTEGAKLGDFIAAGNADLNSIQRVSYGYNRWRDSFARQFLNSEGQNFWHAQNIYDRPPTNVASFTGFLSSMDPELREVISPVKVTTALNTVTDSSDGTQEDTIDTVFLPSLEEMYIKPQAPGVEGPASPYWKEAIGLPAPREWYKDTPELVHLGVDDKQPHYTWFRSAYRHRAYYVWSVYPSGNVDDYYARGEFRLAPLVAIV